MLIYQEGTIPLTNITHSELHAPNLFKHIERENYASVKVRAQQLSTLGAAEADLGTD